MNNILYVSTAKVWNSSQHYTQQRCGGGGRCGGPTNCVNPVIVEELSGIQALKACNNRGSVAESDTMENRTH